MFRLFANPRLQAAVQFMGYALFFCVVAVIALPFTFPTRQLRSFVSRQARAQGYPIEIDDLKLHGLGGIELLGVHLTLPAKPGEPGENGQATAGVPETELRIDRLSAKVALWPALMGKTIDVHFEMDAGGGKLEEGRVVQKGEDYDFEIGKLSDIALGEMGIGNRLLAGNKSLNAGIDGDLNGTAKVHYGNGGEDITGDVDLELADAILKSPELEGGLRMTDLGLGTVTLKVKIGLKSNIAALAAARGSDKATIIHIEKMEAGGEGADVEILTDEMAHILIPPGKGMLKQATLQLHFAINLNEKEKKEVKKGKEGDKGAKADKADESADDEEAAADEKVDKPVDDRVKWSKILTLFGAKLKPFERAGYIGIGCTGPLLRPQCKPELPVVSVGTRGKAPVGGTGPEGNPAPGQPTTPGPAQPAVPAVIATPVPNTPPPEFKPVVQAPPTPTPTPEPPKQEEKKPEPPKPEPAVEDKKPVDEEVGRGRGRRGRVIEDDEPAANEDDRPRRRARDEGDDEKRQDEGGEPLDVDRP